MNNFRIILIIILISGLSIKSKADPFSYSDSLRIIVESENYILIHFHDWTDSSLEKRFELISTHQNPFLLDNDYSYIELVDKKTKETIFKKPTPALTHIEISDDESYIIGISNILIYNTYQLVIIDVIGNLVKKRNFSWLEAKLSKSEYDEFMTLFPNQNRFLELTQKIYHVGENVYIDFMNMDMPNRLGEAWKHLIPHSSNNHLSDNIGESTTNWVFWFDNRNPGIRFNKHEGILVSISIRDPKGQRIKILIEE